MAALEDKIRELSLPPHLDNITCILCHEITHFTSGCQLPIDWSPLADEKKQEAYTNNEEREATESAIRIALVDLRKREYRVPPISHIQILYGSHATTTIGGVKHPDAGHLTGEVHFVNPSDFSAYQSSHEGWARYARNMKMGHFYHPKGAAGNVLLITIGARGPNAALVEATYKKHGITQHITATPQNSGPPPLPNGFSPNRWSPGQYGPSNAPRGPRQPHQVQWALQSRLVNTKRSAWYSLTLGSKGRDASADYSDEPAISELNYD